MTQKPAAVRAEGKQPPHGRARERANTLTVIGVVAGVVGAVAAVVAVVVDVRAGDKLESVAQPSVPAVSAPDGTKPLSEAPSGLHQLAAGVCLTGDLSPVESCELGHRYEVVAIGEDCARDTLIRYLGGDPEVEVLRVAYEERDIGGSGRRACIVDDPTSDLSAQSIRDVLKTPASDAWRLCQDSRLSLGEVSCAEPHTGEYVKPRSGIGAEPVDCVAAAERYMNASYKRVADELTIRTIRTAEGPDCVVAVLGNNVLTKSVRNLGVSPVPRQPG